jgi:hypothetical protein
MSGVPRNARAGALAPVGAGCAPAGRGRAPAVLAAVLVLFAVLGTLPRHGAVHAAGAPARVAAAALVPAAQPARVGGLRADRSLRVGRRHGVAVRAPRALAAALGIRMPVAVLAAVGLFIPLLLPGGTAVARGSLRRILARLPAARAPPARPA